ncbi:MAG: universal stress protein [Burkholderiales bacterium]
MSTVKYGRILAGVDGSEHGMHALRHAAGLSRAFGAALRIVHVVDMGVLTLAPELALDVDRLARQRLAEGKRLLAQAQAQADMEVQSRLLETATPMQRVAEAIVEEATSWPANLIVLGACGRGALGRLLPGSVADGVARHARMPVLLVH